VFQNRVLRRIFGAKREDVTREWRKLHNDLHNFYSSPNIVRQIKSRRMNGQGMGHAWDRREKCTRIWWESPKERNHSEDQGVDGRMG
jgi:hypothetical protein